jgi:CRISPR-associated protein Csm1
MDDTVLKVAMAGLVHDIGKFAEDAMTVTDEFINNNCGLYQPFFNDRYTHRHAVYTAAFIDHIEKLLPRRFNRAGWGFADTFINLAAGHHKPETALQWIIAIADRISSGWDRNNFDKDYNEAIAWQDYRKTRLLPLFESLLTEGKEEKNNRKEFGYGYSLKEISPTNIYPVSKSEAEPESDEKARAEYKRLFDEFVFALEHLYHREDNIELWFEHLDSLLLIYTSMIPSARAGKVLPDVSLYDHSRSVAALATALYLYHRDMNTMSIEAIKDYDRKKFLLISGDFYGIQKFIFSDSGEAGKQRSKILRGRSFAVSLYTELAADMICREIGLPSISVLLNAAGKFTIISPNTEKVKGAVEKIEQGINDWLVSISFGENAIGVSTIEASPEDFVSGEFPAMWDSLNEKMSVRKCRKIDLDKYAGTVEGYLNGFNNDLKPPLCPYCGKRPSSEEAESVKKGKEDKSTCKICRDHIFLGERIVKEDRIAITTKDADIRDENLKLLEPVFGTYQVAFIGGGLNDLARKGQLLKYWDISINGEGKIAKEVTVRFINGYVPVYTDEDQYDDCILEGTRSDNKKAELIENISIGRPKTFAHIAAKALNARKTNGKKKYCGIQALGILQADVDNLGVLMSCGIREKDFTISRLATVSRQLNFFFAVYLPHLLKTDRRFMDVYTVFAGGDDLFLIGPWNRIIDLASFLREKFSQYVCHNEEVHFSAGISLQKPHTPLDKLAEDAGNALERAKSSGRNRITVFGETAAWDEFTELQEIKETLKCWHSGEMINNAMLFRLNYFIRMAGIEKEIQKEKDFCLEDMDCLKWRAFFRYTTERNIGKNEKEEREKMKAKEKFSQVAVWLEKYQGKLKIALWDIIYNNR